MKRLILMTATALTVAALTTPTWSQTSAEHDSHHPSDITKAVPVPANPPVGSQPGMNAPQGGMGACG